MNSFAAVRTETPTNKILTNAYFALACSLVPTLIGGFIGHSFPIIENPIIAFIVFMAGALFLTWQIEKHKHSKQALYLAGAFTFLVGNYIGQGAEILFFGKENAIEILAMSALGTIIFTFVLSMIARTNKFGFDYGNDKFGFWLCMFGVAVICSIIAAIISLGAGVDLPIFDLLISVAIFLFASGGILYDTGRVVSGRESSYISVAVGLYLSIWNMFLAIYNILNWFDKE